MSPIFKNLTVDMEFSSKRKLFALFLGINSDKFHYNSISSKQAVIFCSIKSSVIWILTGHKIYNYICTIFYYILPGSMKQKKKNTLAMNIFHPF